MSQSNLTFSTGYVHLFVKSSESSSLEVIFTLSEEIPLSGEKKLSAWLIGLEVICLRSTLFLTSSIITNITSNISLKNLNQRAGC